MTVTIDGYGNTDVHPKEDIVGQTMIRMRTPIRDEGTAGTLMQALSGIPGTYLVYREGKDLISLHRDHAPTSALGVRTARVQVLIPQGMQCPK